MVASTTATISKFQAEERKMEEMGKRPDLKNDLSLKNVPEE
jgi:hypothetical protein